MAITVIFLLKKIYKFGKKFYQFEANNRNRNFPYQFCLESISNKTSSFLKNWVYCGYGIAFHERSTQ